MSQRYDIHTLSVQMTVAPTTVTTVLDPDSYDKGYNAGEAEGHEAGKAEGYTEGYQAGETEGHKTGKAEGYTEGHGVGYMEGHNEGFVAGETSGYQSGKSDGYAEGYGKGHTEGYTKGEQNGYDFGFDEGKQAEYDAFWDVYQDNGKQVSYTFGFAGGGWNDRTFRPKYNMRPDWAIISMFNGCDITDLEKILNGCGVTLDTSNNGNYASAFSSKSFTVLPEIVFGKNTSAAGQVFSNDTSLHTIRKVTFTEGATAAWTSTFENCTALANVEFAGVLVNNINLQWCPLTRASIESLFSILSDSASGKTVTLNKSAKEAAFTADEWAALIATKSNWTISLI